MRSNTRAVLAALTLAAMLAPAAPAAAAGTTERELTDFAFTGKGWSTKLDGSDVPVESGRTGHQVLGCTRYAGMRGTNNTVAADVPVDSPFVRVGATETTVATAKGGGAATSKSLNTVSDVLVGDLATEALVIEGLRTSTRAWHDASGYHRSARVTATSVTRYVGGQPVDQAEVPSGEGLDGETLGIPGLVNATFGIKQGTVGTNAASSSAYGVKLELLPSGTTLWVGHAASGIRGGAVAGLMSGSAFGSRAVGLGGTVGSERSAVEYLPCVGTNGRWLRNSVGSADGEGTLRLVDVVNRVMGDQSPRFVYNRATSDISKARLLGGDLVLSAIHGEGYVRRDADGSYVRHARGTSLGGIVANGQRHRVPDQGESLLIRGVARITPHYVSRTSNGIRVSAARVELLSGPEAGSTLYLGNVRLRVTEGVA